MLLDGEEGFGILISTTFAENHGGDMPGAKFKVGEQVRFEGELYTITGVNDSDGFEYSLENRAYLVWEDELESNHE